ncbi:MAG: cob(I)yrinic acid a,c-diamide adenosyltransferase [Candidatus Paceibacterota bacterium]|jgi:cob(I)alamin adenosyltransferase
MIKSKLYTGRGDSGTTTLFHCDQGRISKSADIIEALGSLDELNVYIGIVKVYANIEQMKLVVNSKKRILYSDILDGIQQTLFIIQAELAGSDMTVEKKDLDNIEGIIKYISDLLPPITSFTISGGSVLSAELDYGRTLARRCERRIVAVVDGGDKKMGGVTIAYLNRLSSILFAMSRYANYVLAIKEEHPKYNKK